MRIVPGVRKPPLADALEHFGVKGMRWGVRKQPSYDTTERTIKKGHQLQNVSAGKAATAGERRLFTSHTLKDNLQYRSTYARGLKALSNDADTFTNEIVSTKTLKVASEKVAFDAFKKMYDADPKGMTRTLAESHEALTRTMLFMGDVKNQKVIDSNTKRFSKKGEAWVQKDGYTLFTTAAGTDLIPRKVADSYYTSLSKAGYDAIPDHTDKSAKMADDPIIILKPKNSVKITRTIPLTEADIKLAGQLYKEQKRAEKKAAKGGGE